MTIKPQGKRRKSPLWARLTLALGIVLVIVTGSGYAAMGVVSHKVISMLPGEDLLGSGAQQGHQDVQGAKNILLVSLDTRPSCSR